LADHGRLDRSVLTPTFQAKDPSPRQRNKLVFPMIADRTDAPHPAASLVCTLVCVAGDLCRSEGI